MPKQNIIATNFTSGEVSPLVRGRVDAQKYANGLETCENFIVRPQGPIIRRSGTTMIKPTKLQSSRSVLVPFEYSDLNGYVLEFGIGYIHFYRNGLPLWETTTTEIEQFDVNLNATNALTQLSYRASGSHIEELPGWGKLSLLGPADNGTISLSSNSDGLVRITTSVPHTLRTGTRVWVYSTEIASISTHEHTVTRINNYCVDLQGSTYSAPSAGGTAMFSHGLQAGDRMFVSGAAEYPLLSEKSHLVQSVDSYGAFTINAYYENHGNPTKEEGHTIPIELSTDYGYEKRKQIATISASSTLIQVTVSNHGYSTGDIVNIYLSSNAADGEWTITVVDSNNFTLDGSTYKAAASTGYCRKVVGESGLDELKFVQSADVLYIIHPDHPPKKLTRLTNDGDLNDWLLADVDFKDGPYLPLNSVAPLWNTTDPSKGSTYADVYLELSSYSHTATATSAVTWNGGDINKFIEYRDGDQWRIALLPGSLSGTTATVTIQDNVLLHLDEATKLKTQVKRVRASRSTYQPGGTNDTSSVPGAGTQQRLDPNNWLWFDATNLISNFANTFGVADVGKYVRYFSGTSPLIRKWAKITGVKTGTGNKCEISAINLAVGCDGTGKYVITNEQRTGTVKSYKDGVAFPMFAATDIGRHIRIGWGGRWTWGKITAYISTSQVSVSLYSDVPRDPHNAANLAGALNGDVGSSESTGRSYDWRLGAWSETTGYPSCGVFHEQRLWFGRTNTEPQAIWGSISGDFDNFAPTEMDSTVLEDNAVNFTIASTKANPIKWMVSGPAITVGTTGGEWQVKSSSTTSEPITPLNIVVVPHTGHGSNRYVPPLKVGNSILFADRPGNRVMELVYDFSADGLVSHDFSYLSEHILRYGNGSIDAAYQQEPNNLCWYVLSDGTLAAVTINKEQEIVAWHRHDIADATVESIAVVPSTDSSRDNVYMIVKRGNNRYVELLQDDFYPSSQSNRKGMCYLDGAVIFFGTDFKGSRIAGLHHLEGKTVTVSVDGTLLGTYTVTNGIVQIVSQTGVELVVGLPYTSTAKSLPPEGGSAFGTSQGKIKKIQKYNVRLLNSLTLDYGFGSSLNTLSNLHENGTSTNFYTGTRELIPNNPYDAESQWTLSTNKPYPLNILSVTMTVEAGE